MSVTVIVLLCILAALLGGLIGWLWSGSRTRAALAGDLAQLQAAIAGRDATIAELRTHVAERSSELTHLRNDLTAAQQLHTAAQTKHEATLRIVEEQRTWLAGAEQQLRDAFSALSAEALKHNTAQFTVQAEEKVQPLKAALERYEAQMRAMETERQRAYGNVTAELTSIKESHQRLNQQTANLVTALRAPQVRGRWGEITLQRVVEAAGMSPHCDFVEQPTAGTDTGKLRPDLIVTLPGGRTIIVDSKAPLTAYLEAVEAPDENRRRESLSRHARAVRGHMQALSAKSYWNQFNPTPDFVVMFLPGESFFSAALEQDKRLIEDGIESRVVLATPTTLIALLRTVAYSWQQQQAAQNAQCIADAGKQLFERVSKFAEHLDKVGDGLRRATETYNAAVNSWESRIVPSGRRMMELGAVPSDGELPAVKPVNTTPRAPGGPTAEST